MPSTGSDGTVIVCCCNCVSRVLLSELLGGIVLVRYLEKLQHIGYVVVAFVLLQACAQSTLTSSWTDQSFTGSVNGPILVIGAVKNPTAHKIYEDSFVESLVKAGANAVPSYKYGVGTVRHSKTWLQQVAKESGATAILISHVSNETTKTVDYAAHGVILGGMTFGSVQGYHSFVVEDTLIPEETVTKTTDYLTATLFDEKSGKPVWSAHSKNVDLNNYLRKDDEKLENIFIKDMKQHHIL